jgi:glycerate kinase
MRVLVAPAPFKGACTGPQAARAIAAGVRHGAHGVATVELPVADGGEGTRDALVACREGQLRAFPALDPLGRAIDAGIGLLPGHVAVVELASASGYERLADDERDPEATSTYGTGQLIRAALDFNPSMIVVGVGGSATTDGAMGLVRALGGRFLDASGHELTGIGADAGRVRSIDLAGLDPRLGDVTIRVACDVRNPLCGPNGAAAVFGPQKGASPDAVARLDAGLAHLARIMATIAGVDVTDLPRAGAAGGAAGGMHAMLGAQLVSGADVVLDVIGFDAMLDETDLVVTGEGRLDGQSLEGKAAVAVAARAGARHVPTVALCGQVGLGPRAIREAGFVAALPIGRDVGTMAERLAATERDLAAAGAAVAALWGGRHLRGAHADSEGRPT